MFFNNLITYRLTENIEIDVLRVEMESRMIQPCGPQEISRHGFAFHDDHAVSAMEIHGSIVSIVFATDTKILPAAVVRKELDARIKIIEQRDGHRPSRKEKVTLKEEVEFDLLPRAFSRQTNMHILIDTVNMLVHVGTASHGKAETALSFIRECLGSLKVTPLENKHEMGEWLLSRTMPAGFYAGYECHLEGCEQYKAKFLNVTTASPEVSESLNSGRQVEKLALNHGDNFGFVLSNTSVMTKIKFGDVFREAVDEAEPDSAAYERKVMIQIMANQFNKTVQALWGDDRG